MGRNISRHNKEKRDETFKFVEQEIYNLNSTLMMVKTGKN